MLPLRGQLSVLNASTLAPGWLKSVMHPTHDLGSGCDLTVVRLRPVPGSMWGIEPGGLYVEPA